MSPRYNRDIERKHTAPSTVGFGRAVWEGNIPLPNDDETFVYSVDQTENQYVENFIPRKWHRSGTGDRESTAACSSRIVLNYPEDFHDSADPEIHPDLCRRCFPKSHPIWINKEKS
jgi:hypothetical protein